MLKKLFKSKNNLIISVAALVQCLILLGITTFSWIESASSLIIKGNDLPIASNLNYRYDIVSAGSDMIDLSTYFRPTALYQFAQASSADGKNFYFDKNDADATTPYRHGDTTDYNTSYYNFDFQVHNTLSKTYNYYFGTEDIFTVTSDKDVDQSLLTIAENAFRVAITSGTGATSTAIYTKNGETANAVSAESGSTTLTATTTLKDSDYVYNGENPENIAVFTVAGNGGDDTKVNVKMWFEERDTAYAALSEEEKEQILGCTVSINLQFMNAASNFQTFFFDDYTFSSAESALGKAVSTEDPAKKMYFCYDDGTTSTVVPLAQTASTNSAVRWITADDFGNSAPRISEDVLNDLETNPGRGYFFYGTVDETTKAPVITYKWDLLGNAPAGNDSGQYIYKALSVNEISTDSYIGYGVWDNVPISLFKFVDKTTAGTANPYNDSAFQFVNNKGQGALYLNNTGAYNTKSTKLYYDATNDIWKGYYLTDAMSNLKFCYTSDNMCSQNIKCVWSATNPSDTDGEYIYTALGYTNTGVVDNLNVKATGVGTWGQVEKIRFSTELIDSTINAAYRYKIGLIASGSYYYLAKDTTDLHYFAYVPKNSGNAPDNEVVFQRFASVTSAAPTTHWNAASKTLRNGSNIYYATDTATTSDNGQWHVAVVVDASSINIINDTLTTVSGSKLEYSFDNSTFYEVKKLDSTRFITSDFDDSVTTVYYRWTAYPHSSEDAIDGAIFDYAHSLDNGIYFNIAE